VDYKRYLLSSELNCHNLKENGGSPRLIHKEKNVCDILLEIPYVDYWIYLLNSGLKRKWGIPGG